jgi:hypothetical protein
MIFVVTSPGMFRNELRAGQDKRQGMKSELAGTHDIDIRSEVP